MSLETPTIEEIGLGPVDVGAMLFTMVEPHRGFEVAYNRWYERDHFYAGCMIGAGNFAGRRWVAPREYKKLRYVAEGSPVAPDAMTGSYLAIYWVLDGMLQEWNKWAYRQLKQLHVENRMFAERDHIHTLLYTRDHVRYRDDDPIPAALALDHPFKGLTVVIGEATGDRAALDDWFAEQPLPSTAAMRISWTPMPLLVDAPGVQKSEGSDRKFIHLYFLDRDPIDVFHGDGLAGYAAEVAGSGLGTVHWAGPFIPTIPGTDIYTDELW